MPCKYFAPNGKPSILFDSLYKHYSTEFSGNNDLAERVAVRTWLGTRTENFKKWFGNWETPSVPEDTAADLVKRAITHYPDVKTSIYRGMLRAGNNVEGILREISEQWYNETTKTATEENFGSALIEIAKSMYPEGKKKVVYDSPNISKAIDTNGEPKVTVENGNPSFTSTIASAGQTIKSIDSWNFNRQDEIQHSYAMVDFAVSTFEGLNVVDEDAERFGNENGGSTGNTTFDKYISATKDYISRLKQERLNYRGDRSRLDEFAKRIAEQEGIYKELTNGSTARLLVESGIKQMQDIEKYALKFDADFIELTEGLRIAGAWKDLTQYLDFAIADKTAEESALLDKAKELQFNAGIVYSQIWNNFTAKLVAEGSKSGIPNMAELIEGNEFKIRDLHSISTNTLSVDFSSNPLEQLMSIMMSRSKSESDEQHHDFLSERDTRILKDLGAIGADKKFLVEEYNEKGMDSEGKEIKVKRQGILSKFDRAFETEYFELHNNARLTGQWKKFYKFENQHFTYELTEDGKQDFEKYMAQVEAEYTTTDELGNTVVNKFKIDKIRADYDPKGFQEYIDGKRPEPNRGGTFFTKNPKNIKLNPAYERLTQGQKDFHAWFVESFANHHINSIFDYRRGEFDMDLLLHSFSQNMDTPSMIKHMTTAAIEFLKNTVSVVASGTRANVVMRGLTGKEHVTAPFKNIITFLPSHTTNIDPVKILTDFVSASIAFKHKRNIEEALNVINDIATIAKLKEETNSGLLRKDRSGKPIATPQTTNIANRISYALKVHLTDSGNDPNTTIVEKQPGERGLSFGQIADSLNKFTRFRLMALSPLSATGNLLQGVINNITYAAGGRYFNDKELAMATFKMRGAPIKFIVDNLTGKKITVATDETKMIADIMYRYNLVGDITEELVYGESALNKFYALQKGGEFLVQGATAVAQLLHTKVDLKDGTKSNLYSLYSLDEFGRSKLDIDKLADNSPYRKADEVRKVFQIIKLVNQKIHGDYSGALAGKKTVLGRMIFTFRTWMPMAVKERFGAEYEHNILGTQKGRYLSYMHLWRDTFYDKENKKFRIGDTKLDLVKSFGKLLLPIIGRKIKLSDKVSDIDRENINMFIRETQMLIALVIATTAAKAKLSGNDDDDKDSAGAGFLRYLYNQGGRLQQELSMFYMPSSATQIIQNVIPMANTLVDGEKVISAMIDYIRDPDSDEYERGFREGKSKLATKLYRFLPITRSFETTWSAWSQLYNNPNARVSK